MSTDYKDTLNLPKTDFPMKANLTSKEVEMLAYWDEHRIYEKMQKEKDTPSYILHDGPPYANGHIHLGHTLNKVLKDIIVKYKSMKGYHAPYVPGWDCHGLPIEHQVDKKLGSKKADTPVLEKRRLCREYAERFLNIQREEFKRLGVFGDWQAPYVTMSFSYEAAIVRELGNIIEKGYLYKGKKPVHWCPHCVTALAEAEVEYADKTSPSIYVKFRVINPGGKFIPDSVNGTYFVIWTTTPWTIPANMALALHPKHMYSLVRTTDGEFIIAQDLASECMQSVGYENDEYIITENAWTGAELTGIICLHPWIDREVKVITGEHVTLEQGTGVVHTAPGHGEEDYEIGLQYGLDIFAPVDTRGVFTEEVKEFAGQFVYKANEGIINLLKERKALLGDPSETAHSYPHCWRCKKPVIFRATEQWFISLTKADLRKQAIEAIKKTRWIPRWGMERIRGMVENRPDWCISRQRAWGVPIALFQCRGCGTFVTDKNVMTSVVKEVEKAGVDIWFEMSENDLIPNGYKCPCCGSAEFVKETDILDVWFDSGVSHAAVLEFDERLSSPADLYLEGSDQHRGWFQSSLLTSVATRGSAPYRAVLTHGFVVDGQGKKMSKSLGNVISPQDITNKHGAEILRLWSSSADYREDIRISNEVIARLTEAYRKIRNTCRFMLGNIHDLDPTSSYKREDLTEIDRLAMSMLQRLIMKVEKAYESFAFHEVFHAVYNFCVLDMSSFYLDILKDRLYTFRAQSAQRRSAQHVIYNILISLTKMIAPILSFTAEEIWRHTPGIEKESVFLSAFPNTQEEYIDSDLEERWAVLRSVRDEVNKALEIKRAEKMMGNALEAKLTLYLDNRLYEIMKDYDGYLSTLFIVSSAKALRISDHIIPEASFRSEEVQGLSVMVERADGEKCQRCWNWSISVGAYKDYPEICERCYKVVVS